MPQITVTMNLTPERAKQFLEALAQDDSFREALAKDPIAAFRHYEYDIQIEGLGAEDFSGYLPPKRHVEDALRNVQEGNEFGKPGTADPFGFWPMAVLLAT